MTFGVHGRTHRILRCLRRAECSFKPLYEAVHAGVWTDARRKKLHQLLQALQQQALIGRDEERSYFLLPKGEDELAQLDSQATGPANVRVFAARAA